MKIEKIVVEGFKCFNERTEVFLNDFNGIIGNNGVGKTAILEALSRCFDIDSRKRGIKKEDFYCQRGESLDKKKERKLSIDIFLTFPKLESEKEEGIPEFFSHLTIDSPGQPPKCRIRLEALWTNTNVPGGDIDESIFFVKHLDNNVSEEDKNGKVTADIRSKIRVHYIPATRDPQEHMKQSANSVLYQLIKSVNWSESIKDKFETLNNDFNILFKKEKGISIITEKMSTAWGDLHNEDIYKTVNISPLSNEFESIIAKINATFSPTDTGGEDSHEKLSDGMKSLFYFTLIKSMFDIEDEIIKEQNIEEKNRNFLKEIGELPYLNIFAIEEPENHLAPHNFGKVMKLFRELTVTSRAQVLLTSHSPSIIKRIEPEEIRYVLQDRRTGNSEIKNITLPEKLSEAFTYIKEGIKAYPELYFSKLVVLGEGDSEEIVIPKIAKAFDLDLDYHYVSMVPLGGRHVNHFWKLLNDLNIKHITLLDYDRGRGGGDWERIKYVIEQLVENKRIIPDEFKYEDDSLIDIHSIAKWEKDEEYEKEWINCLKEYNVYFSYPIDLDFSMLSRYKEEYTKLEGRERGPQLCVSKDEQLSLIIKNRDTNILNISSIINKKINNIPLEKTEEIELEKFSTQESLKDIILKKDKGGYKECEDLNNYDEENVEMIKKAIADVLKTDVDSIDLTNPYIYDKTYHSWFWYKYLFLGKGKPVSHIRAFNHIEKKDKEYMRNNCPKELEELVIKMKELLGVTDEQNK